MKKRVNITIEQHVLNKLDQMAKERGVDRSTMISVLIWNEEVNNYYKKNALEAHEAVQQIY